MAERIARSLHSRRGFTLIELMTVVAIIGILAALAVPSLAKMYERSTLTSANADIVSIFSEARDLAVAKNATVVVVVDTSGASATGGVYEIEDPVAPSAFLQDAESGSLGGFTKSSRPLKDNLSGGYFSSKAMDVKRVWFGEAGLKSRLVIGSSSDVNSFVNLAGAKAGPWRVKNISGLTVAGCTFCGSNHWGYIVYSNDGTTYISDPGTLKPVVGSSQAMVVLANPNLPKADRGIFIAAPTGLSTVISP